MITTNVRLSEEDYQKYRLIALKKRKSFAELVRDSLRMANFQLEDRDFEKKRMQAVDRIFKIRKIKPHKSIREMIEEGRKY